MQSDWHQITLGEFVRLQRGHDLTASEQRPGHFPVMGSAGQNGTHSEFKAFGPGVVIGRSGASMGRVHYCETDYWPHNTCLYVTDFLENNPLFAFYKLAELDLARYNSGSAQPSLNRNYIYGMPLWIPGRHIQDRIAQVIHSIDKKIDLNRRINQTLEAMAQAIFKSWFVDFDPVKAKIAALAEGRDPLRAAMSAISGKPEEELDALPTESFEQLAATAALFPDEMVESALGEIPKGWEAKSLDSVANYLNGLALQKFPPQSVSDFLPVIKIAQLRAGHTGGADKAASKLKPEYIVCDGDVLFSWSGSLEVDVWTGGVGALNQHLFKVTSSVVPKWFYLLATKHHLANFREIAANKATTMGHIQRKHLTDARIATPSADFFAQAAKLISPLIDEIISIRLQSRELTKTRDALLPKLLSGEICVSEIPMEHAK
ncbi:restriction endonuclease subunit S [Ideonella livida]|uniref:Restriction endonuclease subunit S n=1 Tax=Ideonella livida TaxID=2707176 RepID=A0A7C9PJC3_9BURK|nr:restriction endonuclease subunit S [Ideonella livida]NDY93129.1 restriction endonuclease subunit S [Ideonella livida]